MIYDIILVLLVLVSVFLGIKKGAAKTLLSCAAILLAFVVAVGLSKPVSNFVFDSFLRDSVEEEVSSAIVSSAEDKAKDVFNNPMSEHYVSAMDYFSESEEDIENKCKKMISEQGNKAAAGIVELYKPVIIGFVSMIVSASLFIILAIVFLFIARFISKVFKLPIVNFIDKTAGAFLGLARGVIGVTVAGILLKLLAPVVSSDSFFGSQNVSSSAIFSYIYNGGVSEALQSFIYNLGL